MYYYSLNDYIKDCFGEKLYKIALDGGFTCPTRDGTKGSNGCIFCGSGGSGAFAQSRSLSISQQIEAGKALVAGKMKNQTNARYIAYFQNYTGTYASPDRLRMLYTEALNNSEVAALSIATRPDCLSSDIIELLTELNSIKPVWIELGLQTVHKKSADFIRRGYPNEEYENAVFRLKGNVSHIVTHIILGLPGETIEDMASSAAYAVYAGSDGLKLQLLHILKGTDLEHLYTAGLINTLSLDQYTKAVIECLRAVPEKTVIHRITGDGFKRDLVAPLWSGNKKMVLNFMKKAIFEAER